MNCANKRSEWSLKRTDVKHPLPLVTLGLRWRKPHRDLRFLASRIKNQSPPRRCIRARGLVYAGTAHSGAYNLLKLNSPLSAWEQLGTFDTERECQEMLTALQEHPFTDAVVRGIQRDSHAQSNSEPGAVRHSTLCFELYRGGTDPRLKSN